MRNALFTRNYEPPLKSEQKSIEEEEMKTQGVLLPLLVTLLLSTCSFCNHSWGEASTELPLAKETIPPKAMLVWIPDTHFSRDYSPLTRWVGEPESGKIWEIDMSEHIKSSRTISPWKTNKKLLPLSQLFEELEKKSNRTVKKVKP